MAGRRTLTTIDAHAAGEPLRLITAGLPRLSGASIMERRASMLTQYDEIRRMLMWEPRGHADMYGAVLTEPVSSEADYGIIFMHNEGYSTMCGHGIIAVTTILLETGMHPRDGSSVSLNYDSPAGLIKARATLTEDRVSEVAFINVPSFVHTSHLVVETTYGPLDIQIVFGGAFYGLVEAEGVNLRVNRGNIRDLIDLGMQVKRAIESKMSVIHPEHAELQGIYGTIICDVPKLEFADGRNVTIFADGEVDRSPCGTGTAARLAWLHADGQLALDEEYVHESITGTTFRGRILATTPVGDYAAIVPEIAGRGFITGYHTFVVDPEDPVRAGFLVR